MKRLSRLVLVGLFLLTPLMAWIDSIWSISPHTLIIEYGNVAKITAPASWKDYFDMPKRVAAYIRVNAGLRQLFVAARALGSGMCLHSYPDDRVRWGRDGWLFLNSATFRQLDEAGTRREVVAEYAASILRKRAFLQERGIDYVFMLAPSKEAVYPQFCRERFPDVVNRRIVDGVVQALSTEGYAVSPRSRLLDARNTWDVFFRRDLHWTCLGGAIAADQVIEHVRGQHMLGNLRDEKLVTLAGGRESDLARLAGLLWFWGPEKIQDLERLQSPEIKVSQEVPPGFFWRRAVTKPGKRGRILMFHDSFGTFLIRGLADEFGEVVAYETATQQFDAKLVDEIKPDVVLEVVLDAKVLNRGEANANDGL